MARAPPAASEFLPAVDRRRIVFARVYDNRSGRRGELPYLYVRPLEGPGHSLRLPGGPRGDTGLPGPTSLAIHGRRVAFTWQYRNGSHGIRSATRVDAFGGQNRSLRLGGHRVADQGASGTALSTDELLGVSFGQDARLYWAQTCAGDTAGCNGRQHLYRLNTGPGGDTDRAPAPAFLLGHAFSEAGGAWIVRSEYGLQSQLSNPCLKPTFTQSEGLCQVERLAQPGYL